jgi:hypothetical protein
MLAPRLAHSTAVERRGIVAIDYRDKHGENTQKYGSMLIRTLRVKYGYKFAQGESNAKLIDVLARLDEPSLHQLIRDHGR